LAGYGSVEAGVPFKAAEQLPMKAALENNGL